VPLCPHELDIPTRLTEAVTALDERTGALSGWGQLRDARRDDGGLLSIGLRLHMKNFGPEAHERVSIELEGHREEQVAPRRWQISNLKAFGLRHKDFTVTVVPPLETLSLDAHVSAGDRHAVEHLDFIVAAARRGGATKPGSRNRAGPSIHVPGPFHPGITASPAVKGHSFDFAVAFDERNLHVWVEVEDDLLCMAPPEPAEDARADHLRVYLDGRSPASRGRRGYADGVMHVTVYPTAGAEATPVVRTSRGAKAKAGLARTPSGYRAAISVPLAAFLQDRVGQTVIGFDIVLKSHDAAGKDAVRLSWTGHQHQDWDPSRFGNLLLPA
jgi:hypothetical protein